MRIEAFLGKLEHVQETSRHQWIGRCPAHDDHSATWLLFRALIKPLLAYLRWRLAKVRVESSQKRLVLSSKGQCKAYYFTGCGVGRSRVNLPEANSGPFIGSGYLSSGESAYPFRAAGERFGYSVVYPTVLDFFLFRYSLCCTCTRIYPMIHYINMNSRREVG